MSPFDALLLVMSPFDALLIGTLLINSITYSLFSHGGRALKSYPHWKGSQEIGSRQAAQYWGSYTSMFKSLADDDDDEEEEDAPIALEIEVRSLRFDFFRLLLFDPPPGICSKSSSLIRYFDRRARCSSVVWAKRPEYL